MGKYLFALEVWAGQSTRMSRPDFMVSFLLCLGFGLKTVSGLSEKYKCGFHLLSNMTFIYDTRMNAGK